MLSQSSNQMSKLTILEQDGLSLDIVEDSNNMCDMIVTVDNPEKHTTTMEAYISFRVNTKVSIIYIRNI